MTVAPSRCARAIQASHGPARRPASHGTISRTVLSSSARYARRVEERGLLVGDAGDDRRGRAGGDDRTPRRARRYRGRRGRPRCSRRVRSARTSARRTRVRLVWRTSGARAALSAWARTAIGTPRRRARRTRRASAAREPEPHGRAAVDEPHGPRLHRAERRQLAAEPACARSAGSARRRRPTAGSVNVMNRLAATRVTALMQPAANFGLAVAAGAEAAAVAAVVAEAAVAVAAAAASEPASPAQRDARRRPVAVAGEHDLRAARPARRRLRREPHRDLAAGAGIDRRRARRLVTVKSAALPVDGASGSVRCSRSAPTFVTSNVCGVERGPDRRRARRPATSATPAPSDRRSPGGSRGSAPAAGSAGPASSPGSRRDSCRDRCPDTPGTRPGSCPASGRSPPWTRGRRSSPR